MYGGQHYQHPRSATGMHPSSHQMQANSYPNPNTYQQTDPIMYRPELKGRQGYHTVKVMAAPQEPMIHSQK